jgi:hypothetical protein
VRHSLIVVAVLAVAAGCATVSPPPGGPTVSSFPRVIVTLPETNAVNVRAGKVLLRYDDVIGEQAGGGDLSKSVLLSPWDGEPRVEWKRTGMTIRPRGAWRANTAYTVTVLPGVADIAGKASPFGFVMQFSTGATIPKTAVRGVIFDYVQAKPLPKATVLAIDVRDTTLRYLTVSDSTGRFELVAVPPGTYVLRAIEEKTANRELDPREPWDTVSVSVADSARSDLYVFVHDTMPVRLNDLRLEDSVTIPLPFDKPLKVGVAVPLESVRVQRSDSSLIALRSLTTRAGLDSLRARDDSLAAAKDTTKRRPAPPAAPRRTIDPTQRLDTTPVIAPPKANRPAPVSELVLRVAETLAPGNYRITITGVQNLLGVSGTVSRILNVPKPAAVDSTTRSPAGTRPPSDSTSRASPAGAPATRAPSDTAAARPRPSR